MTTTCIDPRAETLLNLYVDGELSSPQQAALFGHLAACADCRAQFNALLAFRLAARQDVLAVPPAVDEAFFARLDRMRRAAHLAPDRAAERRLFGDALRRRVPLGATLAVALVIAVLGFALRSEAPAPVADVPVFRLTETVVDDGGALYVISPGVTVEDEKLNR